VVRFFEEGGTLRIREGSSSEEVLAQLQRVPEALELAGPLGVKPDDPPPILAAAGEFVLEGLWAQKKIGRSDDRGFVAPERRADVELDLERLERLRKLKKQVN
jgi:magnesium chelatase subunit I